MFDLAGNFVYLTHDSNCSISSWFNGRAIVADMVVRGRLNMALGSNRNLVTIVLLMLLVGCKGDEITTTTKTIPLVTMYGDVNLFSESGNPSIGARGVRISLEGTKDVAISDTFGGWRFTNLPGGTYTIVAQKSGYGYSKLGPYDLTKGGTLANVYFPLNQVPSYTISSLQSSWTADTLIIDAQVSTVTEYNRVVLVYLGRSSPIYDSASTWFASEGTILQAGDSVAHVRTNLATIKRAGFSDGDTISLAAYPCSRLTSGYYSYSAQVFVTTSGIGTKPLRARVALP